ncbi:sugar-binding transcriptional regulator [Macrococcus armenti]|uniref:sugar-binding transcriptional regulator n=1 Tax=Macrococcus armenti TaxID=2875764 RepID=UPI003C6CE9A9
MDLNQLFEIQKKLVPDLVEKMYRRFQILTAIETFQPIGRRALSESVSLSERILRTETEILKSQGLILITSKGMSVTDSGVEVIEEMKSSMNSLTRLEHIARAIESRYSIRKVIVVSGDSDIEDETKVRMGQATSEYLESCFEDGMKMTVTGGSTMAYVARAMRPTDKEITFIPARGGLGEEVSYQANAITHLMADQTGGKFEVLYVPDQLSEAGYNALLKEPSVMRVLQHIKSAQIVLHGIGAAYTMAKRRNTSEDVLLQLDEGDAVAEAFGYYFDADGNIIHRVNTIGIHLEDLTEDKDIIAVAGGTSKKEAIASYLKIAPKHTVLVTDSVVGEWLIN